MKAQERAPGRGGMRSSSSGSRPPGPARRDGRLRRRRVGGGTAGPQLDRVRTRKGPRHCGCGSAVSEHAGYGPESEPCRWALQLECGAAARWGRVETKPRSLVHCRFSEFNFEAQAAGAIPTWSSRPPGDLSCAVGLGGSPLHGRLGGAAALARSDHTGLARGSRSSLTGHPRTYARTLLRDRKFLILY